MHVIVLDTETNGLFTRTHTPHAVQISYAVIDTLSPVFPIVEDYDAVIRVSDDTPLPDEVVAIHGISRDISRTKGVPVQHALSMLRRSVLRYNVQVIAGHNIDFDLRVLDAECRRHGLCGLFDTSLPLTPSPSPDPTPSPKEASPGRSLFGAARAAEMQVESWRPIQPQLEPPQSCTQTQSQKQLQNQKRMGVFCTAKGSIGVCNLRVPSMYGGYYLKYGKLSQVFGILFSERDKARGVELGVFEKYLHNSRVDVLMCARVYVWLCYSVDVFDAWYGEMLNYADENFVSVDDGYLVGVSAVGAGFGMEIDMSPYDATTVSHATSGAKPDATVSHETSEAKSDESTVSPRRSERLRLKRMRDAIMGAGIGAGIGAGMSMIAVA